MSGDRARPVRPGRLGVRGHDPLRPRTTDRVEDLAAWLLVSLGLLALLGGVLLGHAAYRATVTGTAGHPTPVRAVLLADVPADAPSTPSVPAVWTDGDGAEHTVELLVTAPLAAGTEVTAWVDRHGQVVTRPAGQPVGATALGFGVGLAAVAVAWGLLTATWGRVRRLTGRRNAAAWAREWARVEPVWSRR